MKSISDGTATIIDMYGTVLARSSTPVPVPQSTVPVAADRFPKGVQHP
eukprot:COSAG02_NODE_30999_length_541_cov_0.828054_1_plen_47_part_01